LGEKDEVKMGIYNIQGQAIRSFKLRGNEGSKASIIWDAKDDSGGSVAGGVYIVSATTSKGNSFAKLIYLK
jgi:flagellar hook assembly protein FlgD